MKLAEGKKRTYVSLFSGAGVGCHGFQMENFDCIATNELLSERLEIQRANQKCKYDTGYIDGDITKPEIKQKVYNEINFWKKHEQLTNVDVVLATPPCQGMSTANYKKGNELNRNSLVVQAIEMIDAIKPSVFIFENVKAFLKSLCEDSDGQMMNIRDCIFKHLARDYNIYHKVINFKDYGVPSSRPRTLVIGTKKSFLNVSPLNIFPLPKDTITLKDVIGDLSRLKYGELDDSDIYHFFRKYPEYMEEWIADIAEGESAFNNKDAARRPYKIKDGARIPLKGAHLGNKFRRMRWHEPAPCIATRNDQLASQSTIHPRDNRVLSIRELMRVMSIPDDFKWVDEKITGLAPSEKEQLLKQNELNIRRSIGEAVPTAIMHAIAKNTNEIFDFEEFIAERQTTYSGDNFYINSYITEKEFETNDRKNTGAFYTPQSVIFDIVKHIEINPENAIKILEPAVGMGAFLPQLLRVVGGSKEIRLDLCDINRRVIEKLASIFRQIGYQRDNLSVNYINDDFLLMKEDRYDLIIGNPPYVKLKSAEITKYLGKYNFGKMTNLFGMFMEKAKTMADEIALVIPKTFLMTPEFNSLRDYYQNNFGVVSITDYGVHYFKDVFVEIITIYFKKNYKRPIIVENKLDNSSRHVPPGYIYHDKHWLIYRNEWFDKFINKMKLDMFDFFRDRQITNKYLAESGKIRVLKSKNILDDGSIVEIDGYDKFVDDIDSFSIKKFFNTKNIIMPNFTYNTRATIMPKNTIPNGSIAVFLLKNYDYNIDDIDLSFYATPDFRKYYAIVKNNSKFTINIDANSIYYIGVKV